MKLVIEKNQCCGCTACMNTCPVNAITMKKDEEGFFYPVIDDNICIKCGQCKKACSFHENNTYVEYDTYQRAYAVKHKNSEARASSRSGGMFVALSDYILSKNGLVYGVGYQDNWMVVHRRVNNSIDRDLLKGSKYVQSNLGNSFRQIKADLENGNYVLFSGTPCQVAGLNSYISDDLKEKLYTCDIVCHGVPSPLIWSEYIGHIERKYKSDIIAVDFRDKEYGWHSHYQTFRLADMNIGKVIENQFTDLFYQHIIFRPSCEKCYFANLKRVSDLTLGDFWGIEKSKKYFDDNKGVSLVLINTDKGKEIFDKINQEIDYESSEIKDCIQPNLLHPSKPAFNRSSFWSSYKKRGFDRTLERFTNKRYHLYRKIIIAPRKIVEIIKRSFDNRI